MAGFDALKSMREAMMKQVLNKRRHLGCWICNKTFYGYYEVPIVKNINPAPVDGFDLTYPQCPDCGIQSVTSANEAKMRYNHWNKFWGEKAERKAKKEAEPVKVSKRLTYPNRKSYEDRINHLASNPDDMTKYEMMCDYFLDKVFWKKFGAGRHSMKVRNFTIKKRLWDGTYTSNSGKSRMGSFTPYFIITNEATGKVREIGKDAVLREIDLKDKYGTNRRNDPKRNWGLPGSRD